MGSRANYLVVDDDGWRLYFSHWGAQHIDVHLAAGPLPAVQFVEAQQRYEPTAEDPHAGWLDDRWAEGGALIDLRRRHLLFFGGYEFMPALHYRRAYFALLAKTWPGWTTRWACRGLSELAEHVGVDPAVADVPDLLGSVPASGSPAPADPGALGGEGDWTLLTVREAGGRVRAFATDDHPHPVAFGQNAAAAGTEAQEALGRARVAPGGGAHLDLAARRVTWWSANDHPLLFKDLPSIWPGWQVAFRDDDYEGQLAAAGLRLPPVDLARGFSEVEDRLASHHGDPVERALDVVARLAAEGADVQVTAPITAHREIDRPAEVEAIVAAGLAAARLAADVR